MVVRVEFEREDDGRWIAEVMELPGVMAYAASREQALAAVQALAFRVIADRISHGDAN
jgi:predicted RNase H-like HicB family nuclease